MNSRALVAGVAGITLFLAGCGGGDDDKKDSSPSDATTTTVSATADFQLPFDASDALLADEDVAQFGLESLGVGAPEENEQSFCGEGVPSDIDGYDGGGASYASAGEGTPQLGLDETLYGWSTEAQAQEAYELLRKDVSCGSGTFDSDGTQVSFELTEQDMERSFGDESMAFVGSATADGTDLNVILVAVRKGQYVVTFGFTAAAGTTDAPDARDVVGAAVEKLEGAAAA